MRTVEIHSSEEATAIRRYLKLVLDYNEKKNGISQREKEVSELWHWIMLERTHLVKVFPDAINMPVADVTNFQSLLTDWEDKENKAQMDTFGWGLLENDKLILTANSKQTVEWICKLIKDYQWTIGTYKVCTLGDRRERKE